MDTLEAITWTCSGEPLDVTLDGDAQAVAVVGAVLEAWWRRRGRKG